MFSVFIMVMGLVATGWLVILVRRDWMHAMLTFDSNSPTLCVTCKVFHLFVLFVMCQALYFCYL